ncbi:MAG: protein phosphatase CheZ [Pseudomonadota bacterium]|nr:protein phosphatase CheZ [Pseudomonadota bacterium]
MSASRKRVFRIEQFAAQKASGGGAVALPSVGGDDARHREIMAALSDIRTKLGAGDEMSSKIIEDYKHDLYEARKIKDELTRIYNAINKTKQEIATLHKDGFDGADMGRMTDELSQIVTGTEQATETILHATEQIDSQAAELVASLKMSRNQDQASDIQDQVVKIFEACNFQDLTGQRITKVVNAFRFIERRVDSMMKIWGGIENFKDLEPAEVIEREGDKALLNGPALRTDANVASQDDIDALFD